MLFWLPNASDADVCFLSLSTLSVPACYPLSAQPLLGAGGSQIAGRVRARRLGSPEARCAQLGRATAAARRWLRSALRFRQAHSTGAAHWLNVRPMTERRPRERIRGDRQIAAGRIRRA